jgi:capsular exopolysaccharide synthesis family protein
MAQDTSVAMWKSQLAGLEMQLAGQQQVSRFDNAGAKRLRTQIAQLNNQISSRRAQIEQSIAQAQRSSPNSAKATYTSMFQTEVAMLRQQQDAQQQQLDKDMSDLSTKLQKSVELETMQVELNQLQQIANDMSIKLESLEIEAFAPAQIEQLHDAIISPGINRAEHYAIVVLGGLAAFGLTVFGIGYLEFMNRRLDGPQQMDEGLGIRVVGSLPSLAGRHAIDPSHPVVAQLTDSIDSVRTILMHDSSAKSRQVVLVTSATTMEGRTTVASQLAASLARAGRRTLLVDGDLRRPALHSLFDVPLEDGLCEVLRAEVDVADVIRPTHAQGLWLLTAGYCDVDAIHALATEQMQPVFDKLRSEYDFIIIDGAPAIGMSDAMIFGQYSDGAILSVRRDWSQMPKIHQAAELLRGVGVRIIGAVVNGVPAKADDRITQMRLIAPKSERQLQPT